jgi:nucleotide-binding universal stress UspA family protein
MLAPGRKAITPQCGIKGEPATIGLRSMAPLGPITVGYDGSPDAQRAAAWSGAVAGALDGVAVHLVHALSMPVLLAHHWQMSVEALFETQEREMRERLEIERRALAAQGVGCELFVRRWLPVETLLEHAVEHGAGLIVVGQHGHQPSRLLLGGVSDAVARQAEAPVVVVRGAPRPAPPDTVLLALDGSEASRRAAEAVASWFPEARVRAVRVRAEDADTDDLGAITGLLEGLGVTAERIEVRLSDGPAAETLLELASEPDVDLLAAGRRGTSGWRELLLGGVSSKLLQLSPCPVLLAH